MGVAKEWANLILATEIAEFCEKKAQTLCVLPWHSTALASVASVRGASVWWAREIIHFVIREGGGLYRYNHDHVLQIQSTQI